jgi:pyruvate kinase
MRKTKIICTLGPASNTEEAILKLINAGMDAARFNFSHGTHESHLATLQTFRRACAEGGRPVATILDTKGPEIRIRSFAEGSVFLSSGDIFTLTAEESPGTASHVTISLPSLHSFLPVGCRILLDDGLIELEVTDLRGADIVCRVITGGELSNNKSVNIPGVKIDLPYLTDKDRSDLVFAAENDFDYVAASFVRCADDVRQVRRVLDENGGNNIAIIAKIENREGVDNLREIIDVSDGIMVARGDLGVEIPAHEIPVLQKRMIQTAVREGKIVITATQMLDSMIRNPRATRAEVSDVANAVFDGTSCVMLSGETAAGKYPIEALRTMVQTVIAAEDSINYWKRFRNLEHLQSASINNAISHTCCLAAMDLSAEAILTATKSGYTARMIARFRPGCMIAAFTTDERTRRQLSIVWGVQSYESSDVASTDELFAGCVSSAKKHGVVSDGDTVVITAGVPLGKSGSTNLIKAQVVM